MLTSTDTVDSAKQLVKEVNLLCEMGGFNLTKFSSTRKEILVELPHTKIAESVKIIEPRGTEHIERVLGLCWSIENDDLDLRYP